jgi:hypothetical protein
MSRLSRKCGNLNTLQPYGPPRPITGIPLLYLLLFEVSSNAEVFHTFHNSPGSGVDNYFGRRSMSSDNARFMGHISLSISSRRGSFQVSCFYTTKFHYTYLRSNKYKHKF